MAYVDRIDFFIWVYSSIATYFCYLLLLVVGSIPLALGSLTDLVELQISNNTFCKYMVVYMDSILFVVYLEHLLNCLCARVLL